VRWRFHDNDCAGSSPRLRGYNGGVTLLTRIGLALLAVGLLLLGFWLSPMYAPFVLLLVLFAARIVGWIKPAARNKPKSNYSGEPANDHRNGQLRRDQ